MQALTLSHQRDIERARNEYKAEAAAHQRQTNAELTAARARLKTSDSTIAALHQELSQVDALRSSAEGEVAAQKVKVNEMTEERNKYFNDSTKVQSQLKELETKSVKKDREYSDAAAEHAAAMITLQGELTVALTAQATAPPGASTVDTDSADQLAINELKQVVKERDDELANLNAGFVLLKLSQQKTLPIK